LPRPVVRGGFFYFRVNIMAEIKSTLDIIMEKTKNLTMTEEERETFQRKEWEGKVKGWVQRHLDGKIDIDTLNSNIENGQRSYLELRHIFKTELLEHVKLDGDNREVFHILEELLGIRTETIEDLMLSLKSEMDSQWTQKMKILGDELRKREIYGSSVVPNPKYDSAWQTYIQKLRSTFREQMKSHTNNL
jgi:uncharacterized protein YnzC (UPF0291/DUF896 family)